MANAEERPSALESGSAPAPAGQGSGLSVTSIAYHGWPDSYLLSNGLVEAVVVPAIGRVMQLRLAGDAEGVFWENRSLDGQLADPASPEWCNFGGDKCWPAPQAEWPRHQGRPWPPPAGFDAGLCTASISPSGLSLTSPVDPGYGIQVVRQIELDAHLPQLRIHSQYRKLTGDSLRVALWTIAQLKDPECVAMRLAAPSRFPDGYLRLLPDDPAQLAIHDRLLTLVRHPSLQAKIGSDGVSLAWIGADCALRIDCIPEPGPGEFPDGGCLSQVYTNPDPQKYVELEILGELKNLGKGDRSEQTTVYSLIRRSTDDPVAEANNLLF